MQDIFQIAGATPLEEHRWRVIGRALETISVGDTVYCMPGWKEQIRDEKERVEAVVTDANVSAERTAFSVLKMEMYGHVVDVVDKGLTAAIHLQGKPQAMIAENSTLIKE